MKVEEFGFGFPPRLFSIDRGGVKYSFNAIPFGGFVKILGEDGEERDKKDSFAAKSGMWRFGVLIAGVLMNLLFAALLLILSNGIGVRTSLESGVSTDGISDIKVQILEVAPDSPAFKAGLTQFDEIVSVEGVTMETASDFQKVVIANPDKNLQVNIVRDGESRSIEITPEKDSAGNGRVGVSIITSGRVSYPWYKAVWKGVEDMYNITLATIKGYWSLIVSAFSDKQSVGEVAGPIGIATLTGKAARLGIDFFIQFVAIISINLAILNSIPFPALDGGRILFLIIEKIKRSPISRRVEAGFNAGGFALLFLLMIYVTVKDIIKLF